MMITRQGSGSVRVQTGAYSVVIVAVLALLTLLASKVMTVATMDSVRLTNNTHASTESFYAAEGGTGRGGCVAGKQYAHLYRRCDSIESGDGNNSVLHHDQSRHQHSSKLQHSVLV